MVIEAVATIGDGMLAHSLVLVVFGADSVIELVAGSVLLWRLRVEMNGAGMEQVKRAEKFGSWVVGASLLWLAVHISASAVYNLWTLLHPWARITLSSRKA
jgi:hypothetical protein